MAKPAKFNHTAVKEEFGYKELQIKDGQVAAYSLDSKKHLEEGCTSNLCIFEVDYQGSAYTDNAE